MTKHETPPAMTMKAALDFFAEYDTEVTSFFDGKRMRQRPPEDGLSLAEIREIQQMAEMRIPGAVLAHDCERLTQALRDGVAIAVAKPVPHGRGTKDVPIAATQWAYLQLVPDGDKIVGSIPSRKPGRNKDVEMFVAPRFTFQQVSGKSAAMGRPSRKQQTLELYDAHAKSFAKLSPGEIGKRVSALLAAQLGSVKGIKPDTVTRQLQDAGRVPRKSYRKK